MKLKAESFEAFAHPNKAQKAVQPIFQPSWDKCLPPDTWKISKVSLYIIGMSADRNRRGKFPPLLMPICAHK